MIDCLAPFMLFTDLSEFVLRFCQTDSLDDFVKFGNFVSCMFKIRKQLYRTLQPWVHYVVSRTGGLLYTWRTKTFKCPKFLGNRRSLSCFKTNHWYPTLVVFFVCFLCCSFTVYTFMCRFCREISWSWRWVYVGSHIKLGDWRLIPFVSATYHNSVSTRVSTAKISPTLWLYKTFFHAVISPNHIVVPLWQVTILNRNSCETVV